MVPPLPIMMAATLKNPEIQARDGLRVATAQQPEAVQSEPERDYQPGGGGHQDLSITFRRSVECRMSKYASSAS